MVTTIIIAVLLLFLAYLWAIYVPHRIQPLAKDAGFGMFSLTYRKLKLQKIPVRYLFKQYVRAAAVNIKLNFDDLSEYYLIYQNKTEDIVTVLIRAKRAGVRVSINELEKFEISGGNPEQLVEALKVVKNANIDISRDVLETHSLYGSNIDTFVEIILRAKKANLELNVQNLVEENFSDDDMKKIVNILIRAQKAGLYITEQEARVRKKSFEENTFADIRISQKGIFEHYRANIDIEKYVNAMIMAKKAGLEIDKDTLNIHYLTDGDMEKLVSTMIKAEKAELKLTQKELVQHNIEGRDIGNIVKNIIKAKQAELDISADELIDFHRIKGDTEAFIKALIIDKKSHLGIGKKELEDHFLAGADVIEYVKSVEIIESDKDLGISRDDLNSHYLKGGNILKTLYAILYARKNNIPINPSLALKFDLIAGFDIDEIVRWAVNPQILAVEPAPTVVTKDGVQVSPKLNVTVRGKIDLFIRGSREKTLFGRINEAVAEEIPKYDSYKYVLKNLNDISNNVYKRLSGQTEVKSEEGKNKFESEEKYNKLNEKEMKLNESSAYEILDIKVYDIEVGKDTLANFKIQHSEHEKELAEIHLHQRIAIAEAEEAEAKVRLINAKAKVQEGMAEAFKKGKFNFKDYQKEKHIFGSFDDEEKGYGQSKKKHRPDNKEH